MILLATCHSVYLIRTFSFATFCGQLIPDKSITQSDLFRCSDLGSRRNFRYEYWGIKAACFFTWSSTCSNRFDWDVSNTALCEIKACACDWIKSLFYVQVSLLNLNWQKYLIVKITRNATYVTCLAIPHSCLNNHNRILSCIGRYVTNCSVICRNRFINGVQQMFELVCCLSDIWPNRNVCTSLGSIMFIGW